MGKLLKPIFIIIIIFLVNITCYASSNEQYKEFINGAPDEIVEMSIDELTDSISFQSVVDTVYHSFLNCIKNCLKLSFLICFVILLSMFLRGVQTENSYLQNTYSSAVFISIIAICFPSIQQTLNLVKESVESLNVFCASAIPVIVSLCISSGHSFSGAVFSTAVSFISTILQRISNSILIPLTCLFLSSSLISKMSSNFSFASIDAQIKKFIKWVITSFVTLFSFVMSLQNFLSASSDSVLKRSVKNAVGSFIPIVGNTLSTSVDSMFTIASNTKNIYSVIGVVVIVSIFLPTVMTCLCYGLSLSLAKTFALVVGEGKTASIIESVADLFYILCGICAACVIMMIVSFLLICINFS